VSLPASPSTGSIDASSPTSLSVHCLRSNTQYSHRENYRFRNQLFLNVFWQVYRSFHNKAPISEEARKQLESFNVTDEEFTELFVVRGQGIGGRGDTFPCWITKLYLMSVRNLHVERLSWELVLKSVFKTEPQEVSSLLGRVIVSLFLYTAYIKTLLLPQALATRHPMVTGNSPRQENLRKYQTSSL
jgi:hypothetical protein